MIFRGRVDVLKDNEINYSDIPEFGDDFFKKARSCRPNSL